MVASCAIKKKIICDTRIKSDCDMLQTRQLELPYLIFLLNGKYLTTFYSNGPCECITRKIAKQLTNFHS